MDEFSLTAAQAAHYNRALGFLHEEHPEGDPVPAALQCLQRLVTPDQQLVKMLPRTGGRLLHLGHHPRNTAAVSPHPPLAVLGSLPARAPARRSHHTPRLLRTPAPPPQTPSTRPCTEASDTPAGPPDQIALVCVTAPGLVCFIASRERRFSVTECGFLHLLQPHLERRLNRSARYARLACSEPLTRCEREVLHWLVQGKRDDEISRLQGCSRRTISNHVHSLLRKLGAENRVCATRMVLCNPTGGRQDT